MISLTEETKENELPAPWNKIQGALWLLGLALIAWKGWWWPGMLVLIAISGLIQAAIRTYLSSISTKQQDEVKQAEIDRDRAQWLPDICPRCGAPLSVSTVRWTGSDTVDCPYCSANLRQPH